MTKLAKNMTKVQIQEFFEVLRAANPEPKTELEYHNPYTLLVAVLLSAQMTDAGVNKATEALFKVADTPEAMLALGLDKVKDYLKTVGLYPTKSKNIMAASRMIIDLYAGEIPNDQKALEALPGVGRKTANVVRNVVFGEPTMPVDTHLFRLGNRTGLAAGKDVVTVEKALLKRIPTEFMTYAHHWLILHGRYVCVARSPKCAECAVAHVCQFKDKVL